jgi:hypothetical protein
LQVRHGPLECFHSSVLFEKLVEQHRVPAPRAISPTIDAHAVLNRAKQLNDCRPVVLVDCAQPISVNHKPAKVDRPLQG